MIPNFRVWDKKHEEICEVLQIHFDLGFVNCFNEWIRNLYFDDCIFMQSTGLKDKNGVEIFEGDILKTRTRGFVVVEKQDGNTMVEYESATNRITIVTLSYFMDMYKVVVAGNIYENKELLEV